MIDKFGLALITMFGMGHIKHAPGTMVSLVTCIVYYLLYSIKIKFIFIFFIYIILLVYSIILIDKLANKFEKKDAKEIVIDEFLGQSIPILFWYFAFSVEGSWENFNDIFFLFSLSFVLFRFFDILKIFPANLIDKKMKNGLGVVLDDIVAGIYTIIILYILHLMKILDPIYYLFF